MIHLTLIRGELASGARLIQGNRDTLVVGRSAGLEITLNAPTVSSRHCLLERSAGRWTIRDLGSRGGTYVNNHRITGTTPLQHNDYLVIGDLVLRVGVDREADPPQSVPVRPEFRVSPWAWLVCLFMLLSTAVAGLYFIRPAAPPATPSAPGTARTSPFAITLKTQAGTVRLAGRAPTPHAIEKGSPGTVMFRDGKQLQVTDWTCLRGTERLQWMVCAYSVAGDALPDLERQFDLPLQKGPPPFDGAAARDTEFPTPAGRTRQGAIAPIPPSTPGSTISGAAAVMVDNDLRILSGNGLRIFVAAWGEPADLAAAGGATQLVSRIASSLDVTLPPASATGN